MCNKWETLPIVLVRWRDAASHDPWVDRKDHDDFAPQRVNTVGFLLKDEGEYIVVSSNHDIDSDSVSCAMTIPVGMVEEVLFIREGEEEMKKDFWSDKKKDAKKEVVKKAVKKAGKKIAKKVK